MSSRLRVLAGFGAAIAIALLLFGRVLSDSFIGDDFGVLLGVRDHPLRVLPVFFRPLAMLALSLELRVFGAHPIGFHVVGVLLHVCSTVALWQLGVALGSSRTTSTIAAIWFLASPAHSEPVTWISAQPDLVAATTALFALRFWVASTNRTFAIALLFLCCALLSKESAAPVCLMMLAWEIRNLQAPRWRLAAPVAMLLLYAVARRMVIGDWIGGYGTAVHARFGIELLLRNSVLYTFRALSGHIPAEHIWTNRPTCEQFGFVDELLGGHSLLLCGALLVAVALIVLGRRNSRGDEEPLGTIFLFYALSMLPVINLSVSLFTVASERFLYLPSAFLLLFASAILGRIVRTIRARLSIAAMVTCVYVLALQQALLAWHGAATLMTTLLPELADAGREGPFLLVNAPDTLRGAYVLRNAAIHSVRFSTGARISAQTLVPHSITTRNERIRIERNGPELVVQLADPRSCVAMLEAVPAVSIQRAQDDRVEFRGSLPPRVYFYSAGHIQPLEEP